MSRERGAIGDAATRFSRTVGSCCIQHSLGVQVAFRGTHGPTFHCDVGHLDLRQIAVGLRIERPIRRERENDSTGDFATAGQEARFIESLD
jgi:hypothetical protein